MIKKVFSLFDEWWELKMKWKLLHVIGLAPCAFFVLVGCGTVNAEFVNQADILFESVKTDYISMLERGHSWDGVSDSDRAYIIKTKMRNMNKLEDLIKAEKLKEKFAETDEEENED